MKYLIDNTIVFNTDDGTLSYPASGDVIKLTLPASRLLEEFLLSGGRELTREYLLETVWDRHGLQASGNNLNQYVSILRRNLALFECHEPIITLPKIGFRLNPALNVSPLADSPERPVVSPPLPVTTTEQPRKASVRTNVIVWVFSLITLAVIAAGVAYFSAVTDHPTVHVHQDNGCDIIFLKDIPAQRQAAALKEVQGFVERNRLQCNSGNLIIYNRELSLSAKNNVRTLLALCTLGKNKEIISCDNFYHYKWIQP